ncbi:MAG: hypothetical protein HQK56_19225 [Deltaproteobacteria bacterium]|nr:hypothetical protein [Deltaproteobacteria bacterium]
MVVVAAMLCQWILMLRAWPARWAVLDQNDVLKYYNILILFGLLSLSVCYRHSRTMFLTVIGGGGALATTYLLVMKQRLSPVAKYYLDVVLITALGLAARGRKIITVPFATDSDMLYLIKKAIGGFLAFNNPYKFHVMDQIPTSTYQLPLTYLPLKWLAFMPAYLMNVDLRITTIIADVGIFILIAMLVNKLMTDDHFKWIGLGFSALYFLSGYFSVRIDAEISVFSSLLALTVLLLMLNKTGAFSIFLGLCLATNQLTILVIPFFFIHFVFRDGVNSAIKVFLTTMAVALVLIIPFVITSPQGFKVGLWDKWEQLTAYNYGWASAWIKNINFSVLFYKYHWQGYLKFIQFGLCLAVFSFFIIGKFYRKLTPVIIFSSMTIFIFLIFNIIVWTYLFQPVVLLTVLAIISHRVEDNRRMQILDNIGFDHFSQNCIADNS